MQCKCGGETTSGTHLVKTLKKALEWCKDVIEVDLPLTISQERCPGCTRLRYEVWNNKKKRLKVHN